jgi:hypothetical protein
MTEKFPSLADSKQQTFSLDMARFGASGERAAVAVAERERLSFFFSRADGSWGVHTRAHNRLDQAPRRPSNTAGLGWTRRTAIAADDDHVAFVYKRRFPVSNGSSSSRDLYVDPFDVDPTTGDLRGGAAPRRLPRQALGINSFGFSVWAGVFDDRLLVVTQVFRTGTASAPGLVLLETTWPVTDPAVLETASAWTVTDLDAGGWDFDARREGATLALLHRRQAQAFTADIGGLDPAFAAGVTVAFGDSVNASSPLSQMAVNSLTLVQVDLTSTTVTAVQADLGSGENPQIHQVTPLIATVDRLVRGTLVVRTGQIRLRGFESERHLMMRTSRGWRTAPLLTQTVRWPSTLDAFARVHQGIAIDPVRVPSGIALRVAWTSLWTLRPTVLFKHETTDKGMLLTFGHQDPELGALRATTFRVFEDDSGNTLRANAESFAVLDVGHRHVSGPGAGDPNRVEHEQLRPHAIVSRAFHADVPDHALEIIRTEEGGNTMAGDLVAMAESPASGYAYTEMGDGGVRVVLETGLGLPPPTATIDEKDFRPEWVAEPIRPGRAWVRLIEPDFVATGLPGYFAPVTLSLARSLACLQQQALDGLAFAIDFDRVREIEAPADPADPLTFVTPNGRLVHYREAPSGSAGDLVDRVVLSEPAAAVLQTLIHDLLVVSPPRPDVSAGDQPFRVEIHRRRSVVFAGDVVEFDAVVPEVSATAGYQFDWAFSDGSTDTGRNVEHAFSATQPDFSRPAPGGGAAEHVVTLAVTAPDGRVSTATTSLPVPGSLWATLWTVYGAYRNAPDNVLNDDGDWQITTEEWDTYLVPGLFVRDVTTSVFRYSLRYRVDEHGRGRSVEVTNRLENDGRLRFLGNGSGQGDTEYEMPVRVELAGVHLTGDFGAGLGRLVVINHVDVTLRCYQRFTIGVQTSERRDRFVDSQTIQEARTMIPAALSALPIGGFTHTVDKPVVDSGLTGAAWTLGTLVPALISAVGTAAVFAILAPLLVIVAPGVVGAMAVSLMIALLVGAGVGLLATWLLDIFVVKPLIVSTFQDKLAKPETATSLFSAGLVTYAGEGLAEAIAIKLIRQAQDDGHAVADPANDGRDRFRTPFVETIVVSEGECKAQLRV